MQTSSTAGYGLALHTSSPALGLALGSDRLDFRVRTWKLGRETSNYLHPYLLDFLNPQTWQDLSWLAVAIGPGGFTGTRLSIVTVRLLGQQLALPVFAISSLAAVVWTLPQATPGQTIAISMPAQRQELFGAIYRLDAGGRLTTVLTDTVLAPSTWQSQLAELQPDYHHQVEPTADLAITVTGVWQLAQSAYNNNDRPDWSLALPFYGQHPVVTAADRHLLPQS